MRFPTKKPKTRYQRMFAHLKRAGELEAGGLLTLKGGTPLFHHEVTPQATPYLEDLKTSPNRPVPIPRRIMRVLAHHGKASELIGTLVHLLRCLFIKQNSIKNTGFITNGLITRLTGLSGRAIQGARKWMESMGWIFARKVNQRILNRFGRCFSVNLKPPSETRPEEITYQGKPSKVAELAPPPCVTPIYVNNKLKNQYVPLKEKSPIQHSGFFEKTIGRPTLTDIKPEDLKIMPRLEVLYRQAVARKWLPDCEASIKNFVGAATRAVQVEGNPVKNLRGNCEKGPLAQHHASPGGHQLEKPEPPPDQQPCSLYQIIQPRNTGFHPRGCHPKNATRGN